MKIKFKLSILLLVLFIFKTIGQVDVNVDNVLVNSQNNVNNCGTINFGTISNNNLVFSFTLTKPSNQAVGDGNIKILFKNQSTSIGTERATLNIPGSFWSATTYGSTIQCNILASEVQASGSSILLEYTSGGNGKYRSCEYPIIKTQVPTFTLSSSANTVSCGSANPVTFTVTNVYNSPGVSGYNWSVGSGWSPSGSFTTTSNALQLTPTSFPPTPVTVVTVLNGVNQPPLTKTITLGGFNPSNSITGNSSLCTSATYTIPNLPPGVTVSNWSVSNNSIATISSNGNQATLTAVGNGVVTISATLTNACGQTSLKTKSGINVGSPTFNGTVNGETSPLTGEYKDYYVLPVAGATSYSWYFDIGNGGTGTNIGGWQLLHGQGTTNISVRIGNPGTTVVVCRATNSCGNKIAYTYANVRSLTDPCFRTIQLGSNPMKSENIAGKFIYIVDPCDRSSNGSGIKNDAKEVFTINIYNQFGGLVYSRSQTETKFDVSELERGFYIVKYITDKGEMLTEKLIVE